MVCALAMQGRQIWRSPGLEVLGYGEECCVGGWAYFLVGACHWARRVTQVRCCRRLVCEECFGGVFEESKEV